MPRKNTFIQLWKWGIHFRLFGYGIFTYLQAPFPARIQENVHGKPLFILHLGRFYFIPLIP